MPGLGKPDADGHQRPSQEDATMLQEMGSPDDASKAFGITPAQTKRFIEGMPLSGSAPEPVRAAVKRVGKLLMFGFVEYEFYTVASDECIRLAELALACAIGPADVHEDVPGLGLLLKIARQRGLIPARITDRQLEALRGLRNMGAHRRDCALLPPAMAFESYVVTLDLVNCLFDDEWRNHEPEPVKRLRERYQEISQIASETGARRT